jgi:ammonia channel protein AmtB
MKKNVGSFDGMIRIIFAGLVAILILTQVVTGTWSVILGILAAVMLITSVVGVCPLYLPFGISTRRKVQKS